MGVVIKCDVRLPKKPQSEDLFGHLNSYQPDPIKPYSAFMVSQSWNENNNRSTLWISQTCKGPNRLAMHWLILQLQYLILLHLFSTNFCLLLEVIICNGHI